MKVTPHIVLFLDILGYSNMLIECDEVKENELLKQVYAIMDSLSTYIEQHNEAIDRQTESLKLKRFKYLLFSDNIIFFSPYKNEIDMQNLYMNLLYGLSLFLLQYHKDIIFFRGGISAGNFYFDEQLHFVFGSGLVNAYNLEKDSAIYPRIIIDKALRPSPILTGLEQDENGNWYLDYLSLGHALLCKPENSSTMHEHFLSCLQNQKDAITHGLNKYRNNERVYNKYKVSALYKHVVHSPC